MQGDLAERERATCRGAPPTVQAVHCLITDCVAVDFTDVLVPPKLIAITLYRFLPRRCISASPGLRSLRSRSPIQAFRLLIPRRLLLLSQCPLPLHYFPYPPEHPSP